MTTRLYHFTHLDNLRSIVACRAIYCDRRRAEAAIDNRNVAYKSLKNKRMSTAVEAPSGGFLNDYVPFYFGPRSPMMYVYKSGGVTGRPESQDSLVYLVTSAEAVRNAGLSFSFTDGHPVAEPRNYYCDLVDLVHVDLDLMVQKYWNDTDEDPDRKRRRQAEFLVHSSLPWGLIREIGVRNLDMRAKVNSLLVDLEYRPPSLVRPGWYY